jgi:hypothetical protein
MRRLFDCSRKVRLESNLSCAHGDSRPAGAWTSSSSSGHHRLLLVCLLLACAHLESYLGIQAAEDHAQKDLQCTSMGLITTIAIAAQLYCDKGGFALVEGNRGNGILRSSTFCGIPRTCRLFELVSRPIHPALGTRH